MSCPHGNEYERCQDCPDYPCPIVTPKVAEAMMAARDCDTCPLKRLVASFIRDYQAEEAWQSGDVENWYGLERTS